MVVYIGSGGTASVAITGPVYGNPGLLAVQALALAFIIGYDVVATFIVIKPVSLVVPLRMTDAELKNGDQHVPARQPREVGGPCGVAGEPSGSPASSP